MAPQKCFTRFYKRKKVELKRKGAVESHSSKERRSMTPMRISSLPSYSQKRSIRRGIMKPRGRGFEARRVHNTVKGITTPSTKDPSQDSTSMTMPSGVSSFLLDCMDLDSESESTLSPIERVRRADTCGEGAGLGSGDEMLHHHVKNSTLLDLSHAMDIAMQQPPNLSSILELSPVVHGQAAKDSFCLSPPTPVSPLCSSPFVERQDASAKKSTGNNIKIFGAEERTPEIKRIVVLSPVVKKRPKSLFKSSGFYAHQPFTVRNKLVKCRKVTFNDVVSTRDITVFKPREESRSPACVVQRNTLFRSKERKDPQEPSSARAKFFDFTDEKEKEVFFQKFKRTSFQFPAKPFNNEKKFAM